MFMDCVGKKIKEGLKVHTDCTFDGNNFLSKTGIYIDVYGCNNKVFFGGFSCKESKEISELTAKYELLERVLASYNFYTMHNSSDIGYGYNLSNKTTKTNIEEIILGPSPKRKQSFPDAVGLSIHSDKNLAVEHSILELLERHVLGMVWYLGEKLYIQKQHTLSKGIKCISYGLSNIDIPFSMTLITTTNNSIFTLGASICLDVNSSVEKSKLEAIMLANDILNNNTSYLANNNQTRKRLLSQTDNYLNSNRVSYVDKLLESSSKKRNCYNMLGIIRSLSLDKEKFEIYPMYNEPGYYLVRALNNQVLSLQKLRMMAKNSEKALLDPVC
jgi:hypothetical protein